MGNRAVVHIKQLKIWVYTHWGRSYLIKDVADAVKHYLEEQNDRLTSNQEAEPGTTHEIDLLSYRDDLLGYIILAMGRNCNPSIRDYEWSESYFIELDCDKGSISVYTEYHPKYPNPDWEGSFSDYVEYFEKQDWSWPNPNWMDDIPFMVASKEDWL
jgi:hypothetical protein